MTKFNLKYNLYSLLYVILITIIASVLYFGISYYISLQHYNNIHNQTNLTIKKHDNVTLVNYASGSFVQYFNRDFLNKTAHDHGIDQIFTYNLNDIDKEFYERNKHILAGKRGAGYWLWKPYIILDSMRRLPKDQIILYLDGDSTIKRDISPLLELTKKHDRILFHNYYDNNHYTKRDAYILMDCDNKECYNAKHLGASFLILKNNQKNYDFVLKWLKYSEDARILTDQSSILGKELVELKDHRHDQSILSLLALKYSAPEQLIVSFNDRNKFFSKEESKYYPLAWIYSQRYYDTYTHNIPDGPFETYELAY